MSRRAWIKLWVEPWLEDNPQGTRIRRFPIAVRGTFATLLALAGDSKYAEHGIIAFDTGCGYSDEQLAHKLNIDVRTWSSHKQTLADAPFIRIGQHNEIEILNWRKYQPDYRRKKKSDLNSNLNSEKKSDLNSNKKLALEAEAEREAEGEKEKGIKQGNAVVDNSQIQDTLGQIFDTLADDRAKAFASYYEHAIRELGTDVIYRLLAETKQARHDDRIETTTGRFFTGLIGRELAGGEGGNDEPIS